VRAIDAAAPAGPARRMRGTRVMLAPLLAPPGGESAGSREISHRSDRDAIDSARINMDGGFLSPRRRSRSRLRVDLPSGQFNGGG
jgi:hypothetical protein